MFTEYMVVVPIDTIEAGTNYAAEDPLPLRFTLMHWFKSNASMEFFRLHQELKELAKGMGGPIEVTTDERKSFGPEHDVPVWTLLRNPDLILLHTRLFAFLARNDLLPTELRWVGAGWRPHITIIGGRPSQDGEKFVISSLALIERNSISKKKHVRMVYPFG